MDQMSMAKRLARARAYFSENPEWEATAMAVINRWGETTDLKQAIAEALEESWQMGRTCSRPSPPAPEEEEEEAPPVSRVIRRRAPPPLQPTVIRRARR